MKRHSHFAISCLFVAVFLGCGSGDDAPNTSSPKSLEVRAARRAFAGAPPVIPHPPLTGTCTNCHTPAGGKIVTEVGVAPANPHTQTPGMSQSARCKQCHVFQKGNDLFVESEFVALLQSKHATERAHSSAPPVVPHSHFMREDCNACHAGSGARPEITCRHSERLRCQQCHVGQESGVDAEVLVDEQFVSSDE